MKKQNEKNRIVLQKIELSFVVRDDWTDLSPNWKDSERESFCASYRRQYYTREIEKIYLDERRRLKNKNLVRDHPFLFGCRRLALYGKSRKDAELVGFSLCTVGPVADGFEDRVISDSVWVAGRIVSLVRERLPQVGLVVSALLTVSNGARTERLTPIVVHDFRGKDYAESFYKMQQEK